MKQSGKRFFCFFVVGISKVAKECRMKYVGGITFLSDHSGNIFLRQRSFVYVCSTNRVVCPPSEIVLDENNSEQLQENDFCNLSR